MDRNLRCLGDSALSQKYEVIKQVGSGSFGKVYKGICKQTKQEVAIKMMDKREMGQLISYAKTEVEILKEAAMEPCNNFIQAFDSDETDRYIYIVIKFYNGGDLEDEIKRRKASQKHFSGEQIKYLFTQIYQGVMFLHNNLKSFHRDIKAENFMLHYKDPLKNEITDATVVLIDVGMAKRIQENDQSTQADTVCGNILNAPAEMALAMANLRNKKLKYSRKYDMWGIGCLFYYMFVLGSAFNGTSKRMLVASINDGTYFIPVVRKSPDGDQRTTVELVDLIFNCLKKHEEDRIDWDEMEKHPFFTRPAAIHVPIKLDDVQMSYQSDGKLKLNSQSREKRIDFIFNDNVRKQMMTNFELVESNLTASIHFEKTVVGNSDTKQKILSF